MVLSTWFLASFMPEVFHEHGHGGPGRIWHIRSTALIVRNGSDSAGHADRLGCASVATLLDCPPLHLLLLSKSIARLQRHEERDYKTLKCQQERPGKNIVKKMEG
jgi:hypothetical protein